MRVNKRREKVSKSKQKKVRERKRKERRKKFRHKERRKELEANNITYTRCSKKSL